ncbi:hypothetical protein ACFQ60_15340 [Streptomyces zhihengii]
MRPPARAASGAGLWSGPGAAGTPPSVRVDSRAGSVRGTAGATTARTASAISRARATPWSASRSPRPPA